MIEFWISEYLKNEDTSVIEYKDLEAIKYFVYPELSICFYRPFLIEKLKAININITFNKYWKYVEGEESFDEGYNDINFNNVTFDLFDYFKDYYITLTDEKGYVNYTCTSRQNCPFVTFKNNFDGVFPGYGFLKCFGVEIKRHLEKRVTMSSIRFEASLANALSQMKHE